MMALVFSGRSMTRPFFFGLFVMLDTLDLGKTKKQTRKKRSWKLTFQRWPNLSKGQLNSEWIYEVIFSPKMLTKNYPDFYPTLQ